MWDCQRKAEDKTMIVASGKYYQVRLVTVPGSRHEIDLCHTAGDKTYHFSEQQKGFKTLVDVDNETVDKISEKVLANYHYYRKNRGKKNNN
jgi:hypothetical protein